MRSMHQPGVRQHPISDARVRQGLRVHHLVIAIAPVGSRRQAVSSSLLHPRLADCYAGLRKLMIILYVKTVGFGKYLFDNIDVACNAGK